MSKHNFYSMSSLIFIHKYFFSLFFILFSGKSCDSHIYARISNVIDAVLFLMRFTVCIHIDIDDNTNTFNRVILCNACTHLWNEKTKKKKRQHSEKCAQDLYLIRYEIVHSIYFKNIARERTWWLCMKCRKL